MDLINVDISLSVEEFEQLKKDHTKELYEDSYERMERTKRRAEWINFYGIPWWSCPNTGKSCDKNCRSFTQAEASKDITKGETTFYISNYGCKLFD